MTTRYTTHFRLPIPDFRTSPWHGVLQSSITAMDNLVYRALLAANTANWTNATVYEIGTIAIDPNLGSLWYVRVSHTSSAAPGTFAAYRTANPTHWAEFPNVLNPRGVWANDTAYAFYDLVYTDTGGQRIIALCSTAHVSSAAPDDILDDIANWDTIASFPSGVDITDIIYDNGVSGLAALNVQDAIDELAAEKANLASPTFTGNPAAPTQLQADNSTRLATTAYVRTAISGVLNGVSSSFDTLIEIAAELALKAPLASPTFTGAPAAPTPATGLNSTVVGTTAHTQAAIASMAACLGMINGKIVETRAGNATTIAIKTTAGADPSAGDPVHFIFRDEAPGTGGLVMRSVTAALSITLSSGSAVGFINATAGRLWCVAFDDGGTVRLGVINCKSVANIYPLTSFGIASSTAEGGAGTADSAHVFYTSAAVASKAYTVLGYLTWETGLTTAGTWDAAPTRIQLFGHGVPLPNSVVHQQQALKTDISTIAVTIGTFADITNITKGIDMTSAANVVEMSWVLHLSTTSALTNLFIRLMRGATAIIIGDTASNRMLATANSFLPAGSSGWTQSVSGEAVDPTPGTGTVTYKMQLTGDRTENYFVNRSFSDGDNTSTARSISKLTLKEVMA
jgi:hypothetical protein